MKQTIKWIILFEMQLYQLCDKHKLMKNYIFFKKRRLQKLTAVIVFQIKNVGGETLHDVV